MRLRFDIKTVGFRGRSTGTLGHFGAGWGWF